MDLSKKNLKMIRKKNQRPKKNENHLSQMKILIKVELNLKKKNNLWYYNNTSAIFCEE